MSRMDGKKRHTHTHDSSTAILQQYPVLYLVVLESHALPLSILMDVAAQGVVVATSCTVVILTAQKGGAHTNTRGRERERE